MNFLKHKLCSIIFIALVVAHHFIGRFQVKMCAFDLCVLSHAEFSATLQINDSKKWGFADRHVCGMIRQEFVIINSKKLFLIVNSFERGKKDINVFAY